MARILNNSYRTNNVAATSASNDVHSKLTPTQVPCHVGNGAPCNGGELNTCSTPAPCDACNVFTPRTCNDQFALGVYFEDINQIATTSTPLHPTNSVELIDINNILVLEADQSVNYAILNTNTDCDYILNNVTYSGIWPVSTKDSLSGGNSDVIAFFEKTDPSKDVTITVNSACCPINGTGKSYTIDLAILDDYLCKTSCRGCLPTFLLKYDGDMQHPTIYNPEPTHVSFRVGEIVLS
jgi:hypothetical protein